MKSFFVTILVVLTGITVSAQSLLNGKLKDIKGSVKSITITTDSGDVVFKDKDAVKLMKRLRHSSPQILTLRTDTDLEDIEGDSIDMHVKILRDIPECEDFSIECPDFDLPEFDLGMRCPPPCKIKIFCDDDTSGQPRDFKCWRKLMNDSAMTKLKKSMREFKLSDTLESEIKTHFKNFKFDKDLKIYGKGTNVIIITKEDGKTTTETYTGDEAKKKLEELKKEDQKEKNSVKKKVIIKKEEKVMKGKKDTDKSSKEKNDK